MLTSRLKSWAGQFKIKSPGGIFQKKYESHIHDIDFFLGSFRQWLFVRYRTNSYLQYIAGNKLEGDWGEIVALGAEISP